MLARSPNRPIKLPETSGWLSFAARVLPVTSKSSTKRSKKRPNKRQTKDKDPNLLVEITENHHNPRSLAIQTCLPDIVKSWRRRRRRGRSCEKKQSHCNPPEGCISVSHLHCREYKMLNSTPPSPLPPSPHHCCLHCYDMTPLLSDY